MITTVRFTDAEKYPAHGKKISASRCPGHDPWDKWRGREIKIVATPEQPSSHWKCDTPHVWPVAPESLVEIGAPAGVHFCVCVHQVEID